MALTFVATLVVVTAVLFTGQTLVAMSRMQGLEWRFVITLLPTFIPIAVAYAAPFAFLIAVAFTFGRMVADREITALRIAGVHPRVVVTPVAAMGTVLALASLASVGWWIPHAKQDLNRQLMSSREMFLAALAGSDEPITFRNFRFSYSQYIPASAPGDPGSFREFELDQRDDDGNLQQKILGDEARLRSDGDDLVLDTDLAWLLAEDETARKGTVDVGPRRVNVGHVERLGATTAFNDLLGRGAYERKAPDVDLPDLWYMVERGRAAAEASKRAPGGPERRERVSRVESIDKVPLARSEVELHSRLAAALAPFVFGLMAVSISLNLPTRGRRLLGVILSFLPVVLVYFPLMFAGKSLADARLLPTPVATWGADAVLLIASGVLLRRAYQR